MDKCREQQEKEEGRPSSITVSDVQGLLIVFAVSIGASLLTIGLEIYSRARDTLITRLLKWKNRDS